MLDKLVVGVLFSIIIFLLLLPQSVLIFTKRYSAEDKTCANYDSKLNLITVFCNANLSEINNVLYNKNILEKDPNGVWILNATIKVNPLAILTLNNSDTNWLKIKNKNESQPNFIKILGSANIDGVKITSWNSISNSPIKQNINGSMPRPFIEVDNAIGTTIISNSEIAFMGYNTYPRNGLVYIHGGNGSSVTNNIIHDMWDGFYSDSVKSITLKNNILYNNLRHGFNADAGSHDLNVIGNMAYNNSEIGMLCSDRCHNALFDSNKDHDNGKAGLMFSSDTYNSTAKKNYVYNEKTGISIISSLNNNIYDNLFIFSDIGIFIGKTSTGSKIYNNTIRYDTIGIHFGNQPKNNILKNNTIGNVSTPVYILTNN